MSAMVRLALTGMLVAICWPLTTRADDPAQKTGPPLTPEGVGELLTNLGYDVKQATPTPENPNPVATIDVERTNFTFHLDNSLSPSKAWLWLVLPLEKAPDPDNLEADRLRKMLEKNEELGPTHFSYSPVSKIFYLNKALPNRDISPRLLRTEIENLITNAEKTSDIWHYERPKP